MKAIDRPFTKIINGTTQFVIPVFQRDYSWTEAQCEQLWTDILHIADDPTNRGHFLGSVVYVSTGDSSAGFTKWLLIDGQQRVTTLALLLIALRDHIRESSWIGDEDGPTEKRIDAYFLKNVQETGSREHKLVLRGHDHATLKALLDRQDPPSEESERIRDNYEFFKDAISRADPNAVYKGIDRLVVVDVTLDRATDDPQLIFESLNSTGMDLSQSDLIRNFILMRLPEAEQTRLYEVFWKKIEDLFRGSEKIFDSFIRDYIALKTKSSKQEKADEIYFAFRRAFGSVSSVEGGLTNLLEDLLRFARYHAAFSIGSGAPPTLQEPMARLRRQLDVPAILIMRLFECYDRLKTLTEPEFANAVSLVESYVFRRAICGEQTRGYWQVFANLAYRLKSEKPVESLAVGLSRQNDNYRFPDNDEFLQALVSRDMYGKRVCFELLTRLENYETKELTDTSSYSIEHIMPQNEDLSAEWRTMLGDEWRETQRTWLHRLGNLTLTGYNSTYSDRPFKEKKTIPNGFSDSAVRLNKFVRESAVWTKIEMAQRGDDLAKRAVSIWPNLSADKSLIAEADTDELRELAKTRNTAAVEMSAKARAVFDQLRLRIMEMGEAIIEVPEKYSISYHGPSFFLEVLPRKHRLSLLLALEFNEIDDPLGISKDASQKKFFVNAVHGGGVYVSIREITDIDAAMPLVRQGHAIASKR